MAWVNVAADKLLNVLESVKQESDNWDFMIDELLTSLTDNAILIKRMHSILFELIFIDECNLVDSVSVCLVCFLSLWHRVMCQDF